MAFEWSWLMIFWDFPKLRLAHGQVISIIMWLHNVSSWSHEVEALCLQECLRSENQSGCNTDNVAVIYITIRQYLWLKNDSG